MDYVLLLKKIITFLLSLIFSQGSPTNSNPQDLAMMEEGRVSHCPSESSASRLSHNQVSSKSGKKLAEYFQRMVCIDVGGTDNAARRIESNLIKALSRLEACQFETESEIRLQNECIEKELLTLNEQVKSRIKLTYRYLRYAGLFYSIPTKLDLDCSQPTGRFAVGSTKVMCPGILVYNVDGGILATCEIAILAPKRRELEVKVIAEFKLIEEIRQSVSSAEARCFPQPYFDLQNLIVMEWFQSFLNFGSGSPLHRICSQAKKGKHKLDSNKILLVVVRSAATQLLTALEAVHRLDIVHRDVKEANALIIIDQNLFDDGLKQNNLTMVFQSIRAVLSDLGEAKKRSQKPSGFDQPFGTPTTAWVVQTGRYYESMSERLLLPSQYPQVISFDAAKVNDLYALTMSLIGALKVACCEGLCDPKFTEFQSMLSDFFAQHQTLNDESRSSEIFELYNLVDTYVSQRNLPDGVDGFSSLHKRVNAKVSEFGNRYNLLRSTLLKIKDVIELDGADHPLKKPVLSLLDLVGSLLEAPIEGGAMRISDSISDYEKVAKKLNVAIFELVDEEI